MTTARSLRARGVGSGGGAARRHGARIASPALAVFDCPNPGSACIRARPAREYLDMSKTMETLSTLVADSGAYFLTGEGLFEFGG